MRNHTKLIQVFHDRGHRNFERALFVAAEYGSVDVMKLCKKLGVNYNHMVDAITIAANGGVLSSIELLFSWGVNEFELVLDCALGLKNIKMVEMCKKWGATNFHPISTAIEGVPTSTWLGKPTHYTRDFVEFCAEASKIL